MRCDVRMFLTDRLFLLVELPILEEDADPVPPPAFCLVEGHIRPPHEYFSLNIFPFDDTDPNTQSNGTRQVRGACNGCPHLSSHPQSPRKFGIRQDNGKFFAADTGSCIGAAVAFPDAICEKLQGLVTGLVTERIVVI